MTGGPSPGTRPATETAAAPVILETKLRPPPLRVEHVGRIDLVERLAAAVERPLTVVTAPPGFGKTTLVAAWAAGIDRVAWLSLDADDNDPTRFFSYAVAALRRVDPTIRAPAPTGEAPRRLRDLSVPLLNDVAALEGRLVLVLDDYHVIESAEIHEAIGYVVERIPDSFRLVVTTREDPPLPLPRFRARGHLGELRAGDLRFTNGETTEFLNGALGLELDPSDVERLQARTEGWPAALYLAALLLRGRPDPTRAIATFAGDDRHVVDYLTGEVLSRQSPELRSFLLRTSMLGRLYGPLCDAVAQREGSDEILVELERSNLFLTPLDERREWYRYHHLFAELLQHELARTNRSEIPLLHRRASTWYRNAGFVVDAASHATAAGDTDMAVDLVGRYWQQFLGEGQLDTIGRWLKALPADAIRSRRTLCFAAALVTSILGQLDEADDWLDAAERAPREAATSDEMPFPLEALRGLVRLTRGDVDGALAVARTAPSNEPEKAVFAQIVVAEALWWKELGEEAQGVLAPVLRTLEHGGPSSTFVFVLGLAAAVEYELGDIAKAQTLIKRAVDVMREHGLEEHPYAAFVYILLGRLQSRGGDAAECIAAIERGVGLADRINAWYMATYGLLVLAELRHRDNPASARRLIARARAILQDLSAADATTRARVERAERVLELRPRRRNIGEPAPYWELSERELTVLRLLSSKLTWREIASELYVSLNTVKTHGRSIFRKLGVASRPEAVTRARELGLL